MDPWGTSGHEVCDCYPSNMRTSRFPTALALSLGLGLASCASLSNGPEDPWSLEYQPPRELNTERMHLEPLAPEHAELDFAALMGSREHLRDTLHWGNWPSADFTLEENREDLERHWEEFETRQAYAYTVLTPDRKRCIGCIYLNPRDDEGWEQSADMALWVVEDQLASELDRHLLEALLTWFESDWDFSSVRWFIHEDNQRSLLIADETGLEDTEAPIPGHFGRLWPSDT